MLRPSVLSPARAVLAAALGALVAGAASSCAAPTDRAPSPVPVAGQPAPALDVRPGPPLPEDSVLEKAGSRPAATRPAEISAASYRPDEATARERVPEIIKRGRLIVGVDRSNNLMSYRDTTSGEVRGFEADIAREIARDIFGDPNRIDFRFVESSERAQALSEGTVDLVVRTMTIVPERAKEVSFSIPYMTTQTKMLVLTSSGIESVADVGGRTLCAVQGSTAIDTIRRHAPRSDILETISWGDCLMALQLNQVDGIVVDDALLSGMLAQDSYTSIVGDALETEHYGVAVRKNTPEHDSRPLLRQVNYTLERIRADGTWDRLFDQWLGQYLPRPILPEPEYIEEEKPQ